MARSNNIVSEEARTEKPIHAALAFSHVSKTYIMQSGQSVQVLDDINLTIPAGQLVALLGPTGCGKTTLLNIAAGLLAPDQGSLSLGDDLCFGKNVAYVFQHYTLLPWLCLWKNVALGLRLQGMSLQKRKLCAYGLLQQVGLADSEKAYPHELSGGMRQRAAIAQALAIEPRLLLMDEPFGALDDVTRHNLQQMLADIQRHRHMTILFVTHNIDEAIALGDLIIVFDQQGTIMQILSVQLPQPRNRTSDSFTEMFVTIRQLLANPEKS